MNNNNRGNNRRRGRGNNNNRQQGGGQNVNRIDSRARGNAPQLLEKYRKLAHDAHLNGDRVQEEYYLQFADHYFRVLADQRQRQDESRQPRPDRWQEGGEGEREREESEYGSEYASDDYTTYDQPHRGGREDRPPRQDDRPVQTGPARTERSERAERQPNPRRDTASEDNAREANGNEDNGSEDNGSGDASDQRSPYEPPENPFVRENRGTRGLKPRREDRRPRRESNDSDNDGPQGFDPSILPPAISAGREETVEAPAETAEPEAKPRRAPRARRPRPPADDTGETLETVS